MLTLNASHKNTPENTPVKERAQAIVEFAIVLPILLMILFGLLEVGRMIFQYAAVTNASREAARYASAVGLADGTSYKKYQYCDGIKAVAKQAAFVMSLSNSDIAISYDHGTSGTTFDTCDGPVDTGVSINSGTNFDRATVTITTTYRPMVNLIPIPARPVTSASSRTILGVLELDSIVGGGGGPGGTPTNTPTATLPATSTHTPTETATPKHPTHTPRFAATFTPVNTDTPAAPTNTPTVTATVTSTGTATNTPTPFACASVNAAAINISNKVMSTSLSNPSGEALTVSSILVQWNSGSGAPGNNTLTLDKVEYGSTSLWTVDDVSGSLLIPLSPSITVPAGSTSSTFSFTFDKNYNFPTGRTSIRFNLSTPSCGSFSVITTK